MRPWRTLERVATPRGVYELRERGPRDFLIAHEGRVLMRSAGDRSERELAERGLAELPGQRARILVAGLGMGLTLRAALEVLPASARVVVAELEPAVVRWCRGPLAPLCAGAAADPRVRIRVEDVAATLRAGARGRSRGRGYDAILLDLFGGPPQGDGDPVFGAAGLRAAFRALAPGGVLAVWSERAVAGFERRLVAAGFAWRVHRPRRGSPRHAIYLATPARVERAGRSDRSRRETRPRGVSSGGRSDRSPATRRRSRPRGSTRS